MILDWDDDDVCSSLLKMPAVTVFRACACEIERFSALKPSVESLTLAAAILFESCAWNSPDLRERCSCNEKKETIVSQLMLFTF